jgi:hypothetical protein
MECGSASVRAPVDITFELAQTIHHLLEGVRDETIAPYSLAVPTRGVFRLLTLVCRYGLMFVVIVITIHYERLQQKEKVVEANCCMALPEIKRVTAAALQSLENHSRLSAF